MKFVIPFLLLLSLNANAHGGGQEAKIVIEPETDSAITTPAVAYRFQLFDTEHSRPLTDADLEVTHEKRLHFIVYDPSLNEFQHVHPEFDGTFWSADLNFAVSGKYWVWAQGKPSGEDEFSSPLRLDVQTGRAPLPAPHLAEVRDGTDGESRITLSAGVLRAKRAAMLDLNFLRTDESRAEITPYLGAIAHIIATPEDGDSLIHVHAMAGKNQNQAMIHATFPAGGFYRLWIEFIDAGILKRVPLSVQVQ